MRRRIIEEEVTDEPVGVAPEPRRSSGVATLLLTVLLVVLVVAFAVWAVNEIGSSEPASNQDQTEQPAPPAEEQEGTGDEASDEPVVPEDPAGGNDDGAPEDMGSSGY